MTKKGASRRKSGRHTDPGSTEKRDQPRRPKRTFETVSAKIPSESDYCCIRTQATTQIVAVAGASSAPVYNFTLSGSNLSTGPFDQYRIEAIRFNVVPENNAIGLYTNTTNSLVPLYCVIDYDDSTALASAASAAHYDNCVILGSGESCSRTFKPHMALAAYSGAFTSYANVPPMWLDVVSNTVQHYGVKIWIPAATVGQTTLQTWQVTVEYWVGLRNAI